MELCLYAIIAAGGLGLIFMLRSSLLWLFPELLAVKSFIPFLLLLEYVVLLGPVGILLLRDRHHDKHPVLPMKWPGWQRGILEPAVIWLAFMVVMVMVIAIFGGNLPGVTGDRVSLALLPQNWLATTVLIITAAFVAPFVEEILFRGMLLPAFLQWMHPYIAIVISSLFFAFVHGQDGVVLMIFLLGLLSSILAWRSNSIWPAIVLHLLNNTITIIIDYTGRGLL